MPRSWRKLLRMGAGRVLLQREGTALRVRSDDGEELRDVLQVPVFATPAASADGLTSDGNAHAMLDATLKPALRHAPRWWLIAAAQGLRRTLDMPAAATSRLRDVVGFEIERQTPFTADAVLFDARVLGPSSRDGHVQVELAVVPRDALAPLLAASGTGALAGVDLADSSGMPLGYNLLPVAERAQRRDALRSVHWVLMALALLFCIAWMWQLLDNRRAAADALEAEVSLLAERARTASAQRAQLVTLVQGQAFLDNSRAARPTNVEVLEALTRSLPDGTSLERMAIEGERLSITGQSDQAAALVGLLEGQPLWRSPSLSGALQADPRSRRDRFTIIAELNTSPSSEVAHAQ